MTDDRLLMHALADQELSAEERKNAEDHLATCPGCRAEYEAVGSLKTVLKTCKEPADTDAVWSRCRKRLDEVDRSKTVEAFVTRYAWGFCSLFIVIILSASLFNHFLGRHSLQTADVAQMASGLIPIPMSGTASRNGPEVQRLLSTAMGDSAPVNLRPRVVEVLRAAHGFRDGHQVMRVDLRDADGLMTLFVISDAQAVDGLERLDSSPNYYVGRMGKVNCVAWSDRGSALLIRGDRPIPGLCALAEKICVK